ncbi:MAG: hypothetical protein JNL43_00310 [Flavobacteriales bacterium]|nr:hypothetical protein [Flavobacteriales bacterium]
MRFLPHEHTAINTALTDAHIDPASVLFVKRRGWLHIGLPERPDTFTFFREKSTKLNTEGRWEDRVTYYVGKDKEHEMEWPAVMHAFGAWLKVHPRQAVRGSTSE